LATNIQEVCLKLSKDLCSSIIPKRAIISISHPVSSKLSRLNASSGVSPSSIPPPGSLYSLQFVPRWYHYRLKEYHELHSEFLDYQKELIVIENLHQLVF